MNRTLRLSDVFNEDTLGYWMIGLVIVSIVGFLIVLSITENITVTVVDVWWRREIPIENYAPRQESSWYSHPADAYNVSASYRYHYSRTVDDGCARYDDDGRCTSRRTRTESVYDWHYEYTVDRWRYLRSIVAEEHNRDPYIPALDFIPCAHLYCEREAPHVETYSVQFSKNVYCALPQWQWEEYRIADNYTIDVGKYIYIPRCDTLKRAF